MPVDPAPFEIRRLAEARKAARAGRDWPEADRLKAEIEAAGWKVVDQGRSFELVRARPPDLDADGRQRYGASGSVPSRLAEPDSADISIVTVVDDGPAGPAPAVQRILVGNDPPPTLGPSDEYVWTNGRFGHAAALNAGIRRAAGRVVVLLDPGVALTQDALRRIVAPLDDPGVAVSGAVGLRSADLRRYEPMTGGGDATAIDGRALAFRRADYAARGPLDEAFGDAYRLDAWWSLTLRDEGPDRPPRRAVAVDVGVETTAVRDAASATGGDRAQRRNFYRLIGAFGARRDLGTG